MANALDRAGPPFASTSASSSNTGKKRERAPYDVFINHRGPDTKHTLATSIQNTLKAMGLQVFLDETALELGDSFPSEIVDAMTTSFLHIAILSPRYAESAWCLAELSYMLKTGNTIIPVFYNVDIGEMRWEKGIYRDAFVEHENNKWYPSEKLQDWKDALRQVTYLEGHSVKENDNEGEAKLLKAIESYVKKRFQKIPLVVADHPVGLDEIVKDFQSYAFDSSQDVRIVGIFGMGGCGKTTLAKEYYNKKRYSIYKCCFIPNVKDVPTKKLYKIQRKMLEDLGFDAEGKKVEDVEKGKAIIAKYLTSIQVFIVLDDVDHQDQLEYLVPKKQCLKYGSIIIVTSRDSDILTSWEISCIYKMKKLNPKYAMNLFCCHAFPQASLIDGFGSSVQKFLEVCQGLPLSLKVLGGLVRGKSQDYWDDQLKVVSRLLPKNIKSILKVSFDSLDEEEKEIYLDICCFFIGKEKQLAVTVWDGSGWNGLYSFTVLENKCLVEVDERNLITMHDHLRDLGKEIVSRKEVAKSPYRLWSPQQINEIELEGQESVLTRGIRGILAERDDFSKECTELLERLRFERRRLEILSVEGNRFTEKLVAELSEGLVWLRWHWFPDTVLPQGLLLKKLRILELENARKLEEVWIETAEPPVQLRELHISQAFDCSTMIRFPRSIGRLKHLKKISISFNICHDCGTDSLPKEFCLLRSLEHLQMVFCKRLKWLPDRFGNLTSLRHLDLTGCHNLMILPDTFKQLINLQYIGFSLCYELSFPPDIFENMRKLETLNVRLCSRLKEFPQSLKKLKCCKEIPDSIGQLSKLEELEISSSSLTALPASIGNLSSLSDLQISECDKLKSLPETLGQLTNLQSLYIYNCPLTELTILESGCFSSSLCSLKSITLQTLSRVRRISISQQCCPSLEYLCLADIEQLEEIDSLPKSVKVIEVENSRELKRISPNIVLPNLESVVITGAEDGLDELPNFAESVSLQQFEIRMCNQQMKKIQGIENCRSLKTLIAHTRWEAPVIQSLENTESLRRVEVTAWNISALQPCLKSIKNKSWPDECVICARTARGVENVVNSLPFPGLTSFGHTLTKDSSSSFSSTTSRMVLRCGQRRSSDEAIILCFVINSQDGMYLNSQAEKMHIRIESGKWVWIGVFARSLPVKDDEDEFDGEEFYLCKNIDDDDVGMGDIVDDEGEGMVDMVAEEDVGMGWVGEKNRVIEAFYQLLQHFTDYDTAMTQ